MQQNLSDNNVPIKHDIVPIKLNIVPFKHKHLLLLIEMLKSNDFMGISDITTKTLPKIGYIALLNKQPIAAGFLRKVEGGYAQLDGLTSNSFFGSEIRHIGISLVVNSLIQDAKDLNLHGIMAFTMDKSVIKRAEGLGFHSVNQSLIALKL